ncbi:MAG: ATP-dependent DNA helicase RecG [bacterium]|nr:ATP-dependent DNA helicase RecG [bacterium]
MDLSDNVSILPSIGAVYLKRLQKLGVDTIEDLLLHVPHRYLDFRQSTNINRVQIGDSVTVKGKIISIKNQYTRTGKKFQIARIRDDSGEIGVVWFNQPFLIQSIFPDDVVSLSGKVDWFGREKAFISPEHEKLMNGKKTVHTGRLVPIYTETSGISSKWLRSKINLAYGYCKGKIDEYLPAKTKNNLSLFDLEKAIKLIHFPKSPVDAQRAKERLAFDELLMLQLKNASQRISWQKNIPSNKLEFRPTDIDKFTNSLPFILTNSQNIAKNEILNDLKGSYPMNRLLEGDVGSGKTVVAACAAFVSFINGCQSVFMAPTQILARQHFNTLNTLLQPFKVRVSLITSDIKEEELGRCDIFVGTHSLINTKINYDKVGLVVIDEQHKFGVKQRDSLIKNSGKNRIVPHVLTMTATPIPRTVALAFYGDLSLSIIDELPKGRQSITTWIIPPGKRADAFQWIKKQILDLGSQIYVVCPLIEESSVETMQSVKAVTKQYVEIVDTFPNLKVGLLHGKQKSKEKEQMLDNFRKGKINILVATPVVEVGLDVPQATIMVIEGADRFGLAQLHQLRGRVGRGDKKSYCLLFSESNSEKVVCRLNALQKHSSGFKLAEMDLKLRGPGEVFGLKQHGIPNLKIASWQDTALIKKAKNVAEQAFENPKTFKLLIDKYNKMI